MQASETRKGKVNNKEKKGRSHRIFFNGSSTTRKERGGSQRCDQHQGGRRKATPKKARGSGPKRDRRVGQVVPDTIKNIPKRKHANLTT